MLFPALLLAFAAACDRDAADSVPLYDNLGSHHKPISTSRPLAQQYFDQGLRLVYAFNHEEAVRSFTRGTELDQRCTMCYWGIALALGPNINAEMGHEASVQAFSAIQQAMELAAVTEQERAYIEALAARYAPVPPADRAPLDSAYARAMGRVVQRYPDDLDAAALYAEALMNLRPGGWTADGTPHAGTEEIVATLERAIARDPNHPGACHYYIHAVEAAHPERAVACAERLPGLMPGAGHIVHMPSHIYIRVGRWGDAIAANEDAIHADHAFLEGRSVAGLYSLGYYPHNFHFLAFAATMAGRSATAIEAARELRRKIEPAMARHNIGLQDLIAYEILTLIRFGRWDEVLNTPLPPRDLRYAFAMSQYARGVALAALGRGGESWPALDTLGTIATQLPSEVHRTLLSIATYALMGEMALRGGNADAAVAAFTEAMKLEDGLLYYEPPKWYYPIRHSLGAALLQGGKPREAERVYREDLRRFRNNGWSLSGLAAALRAQGKTTESAAAEAQLREAWREADVTLRGSQF